MEIYLSFAFIEHTARIETRFAERHLCSFSAAAAAACPLPKWQPIMSVKRTSVSQSVSKLAKVAAEQMSDRPPQTKRWTQGRTDEVNNLANEDQSKTSTEIVRLVLSWFQCLEQCMQWEKKGIQIHNTKSPKWKAHHIWYCMETVRGKYPSA
jgi:hypothetical protein